MEEFFVITCETIHMFLLDVKPRRQGDLLDIKDLTLTSRTIHRNAQMLDIKEVSLASRLHHMSWPILVGKHLIGMYVKSPTFSYCYCPPCTSYTVTASCDWKKLYFAPF